MRQEREYEYYGYNENDQRGINIENLALINLPNIKHLHINLCRYGLNWGDLFCAIPILAYIAEFKCDKFWYGNQLYIDKNMLQLIQYSKSLVVLFLYPYYSYPSKPIIDALISAHPPLQQLTLIVPCNKPLLKLLNCLPSLQVLLLYKRDKKSNWDGEYKGKLEIDSLKYKINLFIVQGRKGMCNKKLHAY